MQLKLGQLHTGAFAAGLALAGTLHLFAFRASAQASGRPHLPASVALGPAIEKIVMGEDVPPSRAEFSVSADGRRTYFASGSAFYVFDESGDLIGRMPTTSVARALVPLRDGRFISAETHAAGHVALLGADGAELRSLVARGPSVENLRLDRTSWTTPTGLAFDAIHRLLFVVDTTHAPAGAPDPDWSRIAVFDENGKYLREIARYDAGKSPPSDERRTWYDDIEVDGQRGVVYVTAHAARQMWVFDYAGTPRGRVPGVRGIAVLPNGDVAVCDPDSQHVLVYDFSLRVVKALAANNVLDLEADAAGRLYASVSDPAVLYLRWPVARSEPQLVQPRFQKISVGLTFDTAIAGVPFSLPVTVTGRPTPSDDWHIFARPSDGSDLSWRELDASRAGGTLNVRPPAELLGLNDIAVRFGKGTIDRANGTADLHVEKSVFFQKGGEIGGVSVRSVSGRSGFRRGEAIGFRIEGRGRTSGSSIALMLQRAGRTLGDTKLPSETSYWELPGTVTRRLLPGRYALSANADSTVGSPYEFDLAEAEPDSPMQRIMYHEFDQDPANMPQGKLLGNAERLAFVRDYVNNVAELGFTRETDRSGFVLGNTATAGSWRTDTADEPAAHDLVPLGGLWEPEYYLDRATAFGVRRDTQLLGHCAGVRLADSWFPPLDATLQRATQWLGKYPSFYGFNYNDELFFDNFPFADHLPTDSAWLDATAAKLGHPLRSDVYRAGLTHMYGELDRAVTELRPDLARTATPMWQFPAVEGSYAPTVYAHMTESYSHYLSEGFGWPWLPAHSAELLRRPGLPLMAVFDNSFRNGDGEGYLKDALQVLGRGAQGFGVEHTRPFSEPRASNALRAMNMLGETYGALFAEAEPDNEAVVLYSYAQDVTEKRDRMGTPHWERVQALHGAGLMAGLPMSIVYEEDIESGCLLDHGRPKVNFLFLVGQTAELPPAVLAGVQAFVAAGGRLVVDADSRAFPGATRFPQSLLGATEAASTGFDGDGLFPDIQPSYERLSAALKAQFGEARRFAVDTDQPWVSKNRFHAGAVHYVLIASETSPYPWAAESVWGLGALYNKSYWPRRVQLDVPHSPVIYDVFERQPIAATTSGKTDTIVADLSTFPGKLYALAPRALEAPKLSARISPESVTYSIDVGLAARVPLRIAISGAGGQTSTLFRSTDLRGEFEHTVARPAGPGPWRLEATELLGGRGSSLHIPASDLPQPWVSQLPNVELERETQIRALLSRAPRTLHVVGESSALTTELRASLLRALKARGSQVTLEKGPATPPAPATYLVLATIAPKALDEPAQAANQAGLFGRRLGEAYPGAGRGFISAAFAARVYGENCVTIVGGDPAGLNAATQRFIALLNTQKSGAQSATETRDTAQQTTLVGTPGPSIALPKLSERFGVRLSGVRAVHQKLVVSASGYLANAARVDDEGDHGRIIAVTRVGESPTVTSLFLSNDGASFGVAARTIQRFGEAFSLSSTRAIAADLFTSFGDSAPSQHTFSASGDATTVLAPGPYGVVAWQHAASGWREAWSVDYWKTFDTLDWPLASDAARVPSFDTLVPRTGEIGLIAFGELTDSPWLAGHAVSSAEVSARSLKDGAMRWRFAVPATGTLVFPKLYANSDGSLAVVQAQLGKDGRVRYYALERGNLVGTWGGEHPALGLDVADRTGRIATVFGGGTRLLEVRAPDGTVTFSRTWHSQPLAIAFAEDGASIFLSDESGVLSRLDARGTVVWQADLGCSAELARDETRLYAAGWDGRVRAFTVDGHERWSLDLTPSMAATPMPTTKAPAAFAHQPERSSSASSTVPTGVDLLRSGRATLAVGGTPGWKSTGKVQIDVSALTNGVLDDAVTPWLSRDEVYWAGTASAKIWAELTFKQPTKVHSLTVYENPNFPESWPTESLIQVWDDVKERWRTVRHPVFLRGPSATYALDLEGVKKLRYVPWSNYFRNFHTSEIDVR